MKKFIGLIVSAANYAYPVLRRQSDVFSESAEGAAHNTLGRFSVSTSSA